MLTAQPYTNLKLILDLQLLQHVSLITTRFFSTKRKETELKRLQNSNLELKLDVKVKFHNLNPHPVFQVAKLEQKTTPAPFIVTYIDFHQDPDPPDLVYGIS